MSDKYWTDPYGILHGCSPVSPACKHCWAASEAHMRANSTNPKVRAHYEGLTYLKDGVPTFNGTVRLWPDALDKPLRARKPRVYGVGWGEWAEATTGGAMMGIYTAGKMLRRDGSEIDPSERFDPVQGDVMMVKRKRGFGPGRLLDGVEHNELAWRV